MDEEIEIVRQGVDKYCEIKYYQVDVRKNVISVFVVDQDVEMISESLMSLSNIKKLTAQELANEIGSYSPWLNFVLVDEGQRLFVVERYCFFGSIDDWIRISEPAKLTELVKQYVKHLGQDSYFELY